MRPRPELGKSRIPLLVVYAWVFIVAVVQSSFTTLLSPFLSVELGFSEATVGIAVSLTALVAFVFRLPIGGLYDSGRGRSMLVSGTVLCATSLVLAGLTSASRLGLAGALFCWGLGWSIATTVEMALVLAWKPTDMARSVAVSWYAGLAGLGHISSGAAGAVADRLGFQETFVMLAILLVVLIAVALPFFPERSREAQSGRPRIAEPFKPRKVASSFDIRGLPMALWASFLVMFQINFITGMVKTFQPILSLAAGLPLPQVTILHSLTGLGSTTVRFTSGGFLRKRDADIGRLTTPLVILGVAAAVFIPPFQGSFWWQVPLFLSIGVSRGLLRVTSTSSAFAVIPEDQHHEHGRYAAVLHSGLDLGRVVGPALAGGVAHFTGLSAMFQGLPLALFLMYLILSRRANVSDARYGTSPGSKAS